MSVRSRQAKVFAALLVSITVGAIILKVLGNNPPSAGAFCLSRYYRLDPVEKSILSRATQYAARWSHIEIYYSILDSRFSILTEHRASSIEIPNCHFLICNGRIGHDGQILSTENWQKQCSPHQLHQSGQSQTGGSQASIGGRQSVQGKTPTGRSERTIYICVIAGDKDTRPVENSTMGNMIEEKIWVPAERGPSNGARPTDFQIKRTEALVEALSRRFSIRPESIHYPDNWQ